MSNWQHFAAQNKPKHGILQQKTLRGPRFFISKEGPLAEGAMIVHCGWGRHWHEGGGGIGKGGRVCVKHGSPQYPPIAPTTFHVFSHRSVCINSMTGFCVHYWGRVIMGDTYSCAPFDPGLACAWACFWHTIDLRGASAERQRTITHDKWPSANMLNGCSCTMHAVLELPPTIDQQFLPSTTSTAMCKHGTRCRVRSKKTHPCRGVGGEPRRPPHTASVTFLPALQNALPIEGLDI